MPSNKIFSSKRSKRLVDPCPPPGSVEGEVLNLRKTLSTAAARLKARLNEAEVAHTTSSPSLDVLSDLMVKNFDFIKLLEMEVKNCPDYINNLIRTLETLVDGKSYDYLSLCGYVMDELEICLLDDDVKENKETLERAVESERLGSLNI